MPALVYPLLLALALHLGGWAYWLLVPFNILLVPLLDHLAQALVPRWQPSARLRRRCYAMHGFWVLAAAQAVLLGVALVHAVSQSLTPLEYMGLVSSAGLMTGTAGITAAHELIHRRDPRERGLGLAFLAMVTYMHFRIEHVHGHHRHVATDRDPASARLGEGFPAFFARSLAGGFAGAWRVECARLRRCGLPVLGRANRCLHYLAIQAAVYGGVLLAFGPGGALFFLLQSLMAVHLLEAVNYVQHYGLRREGALEPRHAWDSDAPFSALFSFNLSTHAAHHLRALQPAHQLESHPHALRLPLSFFLMVFLALLPPVWRRLMDHRVHAATGLRGDGRTKLVALPETPLYGEYLS